VDSGSQVQVCCSHCSPRNNMFDQRIDPRFDYGSLCTSRPSSCTARSCTDSAGADADGMAFDQLIIAANTSELVSHIAILDSAAHLFKALSARKTSSFAAFGGGRDRAMNREALDEHEATLDLLSGQYAEVRALLGVLRTLLLLLRLPALQLSCVGYDSPSDLSLAQMRVDRLEKAEDMMFLSDCIRSDDLLVDLLVDRTHPQVSVSDFFENAFKGTSPTSSCT
jgi:hypothetical protein